MKKVLSVLSVVVLLGSFAPSANANPNHNGMPSPNTQGNAPQQAYHEPMPATPHRIAPAPVMHRHVGVSGVLARRGYWDYPYYDDYRLGWYGDDYYSYHRPPYRYWQGGGVYLNVGIPIRF